MKNFLLKLVAITLLSGFFHACNETLVEEPTSDNLELKSAQNGLQSYIVVLNDAELNAELSNLKGYEKKQLAAQKAAEKVIKRAGITDSELGFVYGTALQGFSVKIPPGQLKKLENDPAIISVTEDKLITLIKPGKEEVTVTVTQSTPWGIARVKAGTTYTGDNVAWIIDTGIDLDHPDLNVDAGSGKTFVTRTSSPDDDNGHGSHVAGTVAAIDNTEGVVGVAAGATVIPVKVLDRRGSGYMSWIIGGVDYVAANGKAGDVANMSLGGSYYKDLNDAVIAAASQGIKFSLAAGNESTSATTKSPASANGPNIFTISAMDINDNFASFSNYGNPPVDYCEPGVSILSTYKGGAYATMSGTSMAAPHMAGLLLLENSTTNGTVKNDPDGNSDSILVYDGNVTLPTNNPPVADAGENIIKTEGELVTLDGSGSYDPDSGDEIETYLWTSADDIVLSDPTIANPTFTAPQVDVETTYTFSLVVNDGQVDSNTDQVNVTVKDSNTGGGEIVLDGEITGNKVKKVTLTWTGATGATVTLFINDAPVVITNSGSYIENLGKITGGTFEYYIVDEAGIESNLLDLSF